MHSKLSLSKTLPLALLCGSLAACGSSNSSGGAGGAAASSFTTLSGGSAAAAMTPSSVTENFRASGGNRVSFAVGLDATTGENVAAAGIDLVSVGGVQTTGTASYNTSYGINLREGTDGSSPDVIQDSGAITLLADFDAGTLTGSVSGPLDSFDVNGTLSGGEIGGSVTFNYEDSSSAPQTINGTLDGHIGTFSAIGAFHGSDSDTVMAGGFVGTFVP